MKCMLRSKNVPWTYIVFEARRGHTYIDYPCLLCVLDIKLWGVSLNKGPAEAHLWVRDFLAALAFSPVSILNAIVFTTSGYTWSYKFADLCHDKNVRAYFVECEKTFLKRHGCVL